MRTVGGLHEQMLKRENLLSAVHLASRGRRQQPCVRRYLENLDAELDDLHDQLASASPRCGECHQFEIHDPKRRLITAPVFRERVLHHAVMNVCAPVLDRRLMHHSYACRKGKGTFAALRAAKAAARRASWFLKLDVRKYFDSIPHDRLLAALGRVFREAPVLRVLNTLLRGYGSAPTGLPIGTLISQHLANFYLAALDTFILQELQPSSGCVRYMDDLAIWFDDKASARTARDRIIGFTHSQLALEFKTAFINRTAHGMDFLGHRVFPQRTGLNRSSRQRFKAKLHGLNEAWLAGSLSEMGAQARATALVSFTSHADSLAWRQRVLRDLEDRPQATTACCAAAHGSTTAGMPDPPTATTTRPTTPTTTSASVLAPAPADCRSALMEQACPPALWPPAADKPASPRHRSVSTHAEDGWRGTQSSSLS